MSCELVLVAGSEAEVRDALTVELRLAGYETVQAQTPEQTLLILAGQAPAALVLADLPDLAGSLALLRVLRAGRQLPYGTNPGVPVLVRSATVGDLGELLALEAGADDFRSSSGAPGVLRARVARLLERLAFVASPSRLQLGALDIDLSARAAQCGGRMVRCGRLEFDLLARLAAEPDRAIAVPQLLADVWGHEVSLRTRVVDATACRLRRRLADAGGRGYVVNVRGKGYRLLPAS